MATGMPVAFFPVGEGDPAPVRDRVAKAPYQAQGRGR